jgi:hypothetical protein
MKKIQETKNFEIIYSFYDLLFVATDVFNTRCRVRDVANIYVFSYDCVAVGRNVLLPHAEYTCLLLPREH